MAESSSSSIPGLDGLAIETVEWLPSGAESGLVRVRGRWLDDGARQPDLPGLALRAAGAEHRFDSLPDARFSRDPSSWRGTYLVPAELVATDPDALWLEWPSGARAGLPTLSRGVEPPPVPGAGQPAEPPDEGGGEVIDRAVLAERRARRAEAAESRQARVAAEALKAVEVLELRSAELERRLEEATAERDALAARETEGDEHRGALSAALASAAELRARSREWQLRLRTHEITRAGDAVRLAVLEAERTTTAPALREGLGNALSARAKAEADASAASAALESAEAEATSTRAELESAQAEAASTRAALDEAQAAATAARAAVGEIDGRFTDARSAWERRRAELEAELTSVRAALDEARALEATVATAEARLAVETVARTTLEDELDRERAARAAERSTAADLRHDLELARADNDGLRAELYSAQDAAAAAAQLHAELERLRPELATARAAAAVTEDLRSTAFRLQADLEAARRDAAAAADGLRAELEIARSNAAAATAAADDLRAELEIARSHAAAADGLRAELEIARSQSAATDGLRAEVETALDELRAELDAARAESAAARSSLGDLRAELEAERAARSAEAERIADLERTAATGREELERLAREQAAATAAQQPSQESTRLVADLDAAAAALRARTPEPPAPDAEPVGEDGPWPDAQAPAEPAVEPPAPSSEGPAAETWTQPSAPVELPAPDAEPALEWAAESDEPAAPDCEPAVEWSGAVEGEREAVTPGVEPPRAGPDAADVAWAPAGFTRSGVSLEPPAPDAEPYVEWEPPETIAATRTPEIAEPEPAPPDAVPPGIEPSPVRIVSASTPPPRGLVLGTEKRDYPLLRGAIVKLAHDDPALAGRVLAALLPAQAVAIDGPLAYDLTITGLGTFAVKIAKGRADVEPIDRRRGRPQAEFHLSADPLILAELLAGVEHRIGRFFGPARVRGRKRRLKDLHVLPHSTSTFADAARAGATLDPELVYRTFAYAVHPSWTRGHTFTVAQTVEGDPPQTWYLTAQDGAGLRASAAPPDTPPAATVTMSREVFDRLLRAEPVPHGLRPTVRGDRDAVALVQSWTERAR